MFKYIGFYAIGVFCVRKEYNKLVDKKFRKGIFAIFLIGLNFCLSSLNLTKGIMWFVTAIIVVIITMFICSLGYKIIIRITPWMVGKKVH